MIQDWLGYVAILAIGFLASVWWLPVEDPNIVQGTVFLFGLWGLVFNYLPVLGMACLRDPVVKYYYLPVTVISSSIYLYGVVHVYT